MPPSYSYNFYDIGDLIRLVRNIGQHHNEGDQRNREMLLIIGNSLKKIIRFFTCHIPWLIIVADQIVNEFKAELNQ